MKVKSMSDLHQMEREGRGHAQGLRFVEVKPKADATLAVMLDEIRRSGATIEEAILLSAKAMAAAFAEHRTVIEIPEDASRNWSFEVERDGQGLLKRIVARPIQ